MADEKKTDKAAEPAKAKAAVDAGRTDQGAQSRADEGVPFARHETEPDTIVNLATTESGDDRRFELSVGGRTYTHVGVDAEGHWTYRYTP